SRFMVRELPTGRLKLRLFLVRAMLGDGSRPGGILRAESFPRNRLRGERREQEYPRLAEALPAQLLKEGRRASVPGCPRPVTGTAPKAPTTGGPHANDRSCLGRVGRNPPDQYQCRRRRVVRHL